MDIPIIMNMIPAIFVINVLSILFAMSLPRKIARRDNSNNAIIIPIKTRMELYRVANTAAASCVLSPHSVRKTKRNPERKGVFKY